jgi:streptogramin lyase
MLLGSWGLPGAAPGAFRVPHSVAVGADGRVWVCDRENERLQIFDPEGAFLEQWMDLQRPAALAFDDAGNVHVAELAWWVGDYSWRDGPIATDAPARLSVFAPDGTLRARYGGPGSPLTFDAPHGLAFDAAGDLYVAEITGNLLAAGHPSSTRRTVQKLVRTKEDA